MAEDDPEAPRDYGRRARRTDRNRERNRNREDPEVTSSDRLGNSTENNAGMNYLSPNSVEREPVAPRKERQRRSKTSQDSEAAANDDEAVEGAAAAAEASPKKSLKKERKGENSANKRKQKKNLREKRRSTGVVIMPGRDSEEDEDKTVKANTQQNEQLVDDGQVDQDEDTPKSSRGSANRIEQKAQRESDLIERQRLQEKIDKYESALKDATKELDQLRLENKRLKEENSSLLRVVSQLSTMKSK